MYNINYSDFAITIKERKMIMYLGNLSLNEIENRCGVEFPKDLKDYMADKHQAHASDVAKGKWHCFDAPFMLVCGGMEMAKHVADYLTPLASNFKESLSIGISEYDGESK